MCLGQSQQLQKRAGTVGRAPTVVCPVTACPLCSASSHPVSQPLGVFGDAQAQAAEADEREAKALERDPRCQSVFKLWVFC